MGSFFKEVVLTSAFNVEKSWLWLILLIAFLTFFLVSLVLIYHWHRYSRGEKAVFMAGAIYFIGSIFLFLGAVASLVLYSSA